MVWMDFKTVQRFPFRLWAKLPKDLLWYQTDCSKGVKRSPKEIGNCDSFGQIETELVKQDPVASAKTFVKFKEAKD